MLELKETPITSNTQFRIPNYLQILLAAISFAGLVYFLFATGWNIFELVRTILGLLVLWLPIGGLCFIVLEKQVSDRLVRFTLSAIGSYALTTLAYFAFSVMNIVPLFYIAQAVAIVWLIVHLARRRQEFTLPKISNWQNINWLLVMLIVLSLITNIRYQTGFVDDPATGDRIFKLFGDQTYHVALAYELDRNTPPLQQANQAGLKERAYHMFPHLTMMLMARFSGQGDILRAHLIYNYTFIEIMLCLAVYCLIKIITGSRWAAYMGTALLYVLAVTFPALGPNYLGYFYFTLYPHSSSSVEPAALNSPQMYSGILVMYGVILTTAVLSYRVYKKQHSGALVIFLAILVAAILRFRIQIFLPLIPVFFLIMGYAFWRTRQKVYLLAGAITGILSGWLYFEMQSPVYLPNTAKINISYNGLTEINSTSTWINNWPGGASIYNGLSGLIKDQNVLDWVWQIISMTGFVLFNMVGIPLLIATVFYLRGKSAKREWLLFSVVTVGLTVFSILEATTINISYDPYSVGGQMLLQTGWYLFPIMGIGLWKVYGWLQKRLSLRTTFWLGISVVIVLLFGLLQQVRGRSTLEQIWWDDSVRLSKTEQAVIDYIHDQTPKNTVIISNQHRELYFNVFGAFAGRADYFEYTATSLNVPLIRESGNEDRSKRIEAIWAATDPTEFCKLLVPTAATKLVEYDRQPLKVTNASCLKQEWISQQTGEKIRIWQIIRS